MASPQAKAIENQFRLMRSLSETVFDLEQERENTRDAHELTGQTDDVRYERDELAGIAVLRAIPERDLGRFNVVFLHGGAFCLMSSRTHHRFAGHIATACKAQVILPDYALAPERPFPAALHECVAVLGAAQDERSDGMAALMGDSAGGGLALSVLLRVRDQGATPPFASVLMAPWLDLTLSSPSVRSATESDVILAEDNLRKMAELYLNGADPDDPLASPLFGCFRDLPPLYVQASGRDLLRDDCMRLRDAFTEQGLTLEIELFADMLHSFQFFAGNMPEAEDAIRRAAAFLEGRYSEHRTENTEAG